MLYEVITKPITGGLVLSHESGIHTSCLMKDRSTYQLIPANKVGRKEEDFLIGKHSGKSTIIHFLTEANLPAGEETCNILLELVKSKAELLKRSITKDELFELYTGLYSTKSLEIVNNKY